MNYTRCGMAQAKLTRIALRLRRESAINNKCRAINVRGNIIFRKFHMCSVSVKLKLFLLRFYVYSSPVVDLQENVNLQVANNLSQHPKNEHWFV